MLVQKNEVLSIQNDDFLRCYETCAKENGALRRHLDGLKKQRSA